MTQAFPSEDHSSANAVLHKVEQSRRHPAPDSYPPISSIPPTPPERLAQAAEDVAEDGLKDDKQAPTTILYLAYGSNMCAETFLGMRRIRPLSRVNVSVPSLRLTFDQPGLPYQEPCFANVSHRKLPDPKHLPSSAPQWNGGLVGVVYEVTEKDYRNIMRSEGAGVGYKEIVVPCTAIPSGVKQSPFQNPPQPFLAKTLYAYFDEDSCKGNRWRRLMTGTPRPSQHAQATARYLKLLKDGAREHGLPDAYQQYLASLQPYTITAMRQKMGQLLFMVLWAPPVLLFLGMTNLVADDTGKIPKWLAASLTGVFNLMWMTYDEVFRPVFGDGERTQGTEEAVGATDEKKSA